MFSIFSYQSLYRASSNAAFEVRALHVLFHTLKTSVFAGKKFENCVHRVRFLTNSKAFDIVHGLTEIGAGKETSSRDYVLGTGE